MCISSGNCIELQKLVNTELQKVVEWMRFNKLINTFAQGVVGRSPQPASIGGTGTHIRKDLGVAEKV